MRTAQSSDYIMPVKTIENLQTSVPLSEEELLEAEAAEYLEYLNERGERVRLAREKYPQEYTDYKNTNWNSLNASLRQKKTAVRET